MVRALPARARCMWHKYYVRGRARASVSGAALGSVMDVGDRARAAGLFVGVCVCVLA